MHDLFLSISIFSIIALIVGMIKPNFVLKFLEKEKRNRKYVSLVFGISLLVSFILFGMTADTTESEAIAPNQIEEVEEEEEAEKAQREKEEKEKYNTGITRDDIARDKDGLKGEYVKFSGKVVQIMQGDGFKQYRLAVNDDNKQMIRIQIANDLIDSNILEDDYITIEGMSVGNHTYTTVLGAKKTIPAVVVDNVYLD